MGFENKDEISRVQVSMAVKIQVEIFWVVAPCKVVVEYQRFRRTLLLLSSG
jgi:hypothetical protein